MRENNAGVRDGSVGRARAAMERRGSDHVMRNASPEHSSWGDKLIAGVPARIMRPRLVFIACLVALVAFGLLMVFSASSVEALSEQGDALYFFKRQFGFAAVGSVLCALISFRAISWDFATTKLAKGVWGALAFVLLLVLFVGAGSGGAKRWIRLFAGFLFQPSEFIKPLIIILVAGVLRDFYDEERIDSNGLLKRLALYVGVPALLILVEPDTGTFMIIFATVFAMLFLCGLSWKVVWGAVGFVVVLLVGMIALTPYRLERFLVQSDPWLDKYGSGFQATLAIMAFTSGGLFGRGIGNSTMKYSYLPEAHNDYIFSIIGEELGFVGTMLFLAIFALLIYAAFQIGRQAPDLKGQMIAQGSALMLALQFFINAAGVLNVIPMSGKTMPFISYGGSSMISCLILAGLIIRVSVESNARTVYDARRRSFAVMDEDNDVSDHIGVSTTGRVRTRSGRAVPNGRTGFAVMDGKPAQEPHSCAARSQGSHPRRPSSRTDGGWNRVDLNADPTDRLRGDGRDGQPRRRSDYGRDRYDR